MQKNLGPSRLQPAAGSGYHGNHKAGWKMRKVTELEKLWKPRVYGHQWEILEMPLKKY